MRKICQLLLKWAGWKRILEVKIPQKCIACVAPHTSNWDLFVAKIYYKATLDGQVHFLMKKEWFFFPLGYIFKALGGIPVDRKKKMSLTEQIIEEFNKRDFFRLALAPEGTRQKNPNWKTGFYYMALGANVPIALAYLDYSLKEIGVKKIFYPTGNETADIVAIKTYYKDFKGKKPENFAI